jgi:hypothetical protein
MVVISRVMRCCCCQGVVVVVYLDERRPAAYKSVCRRRIGVYSSSTGSELRLPYLPPPPSPYTKTNIGGRDIIASLKQVPLDVPRSPSMEGSEPARGA